MVIDCTADKFKSLRDPYTGHPLRVKMVVRPGSAPMFFCPGAYSPLKEFATYAEFISAHPLVRVSEASAKCPYTGERMDVVSAATGVSFSGGFDPHLLREESDFLYRITMRGGVSEYPECDASVRVEFVDPSAPAASPSESVDLGEDALRTADRFVSAHRKDIGCEPASVSMFCPNNTGVPRDII